MDDTDALSCTTGPSVPKEAPLPIDRTLASGRQNAKRRGTLPPRFETAYITAGIPEPRTSGDHRATMGATSKPPNAGVRTVVTVPRTGPSVSGTSRRNCTVMRTATSNVTAANPANAPTSEAVTITESASPERSPGRLLAAARPIRAVRLRRPIDWRRRRSSISAGEDPTVDGSLLSCPRGMHVLPWRSNAAAQHTESPSAGPPTASSRARR